MWNGDEKKVNLRVAIWRRGGRWRGGWDAKWLLVRSVLLAWSRNRGKRSKLLTLREGYSRSITDWLPQSYKLLALGAVIVYQKKFARMLSKFPVWCAMVITKGILGLHELRVENTSLHYRVYLGAKKNFQLQNLHNGVYYYYCYYFVFKAWLLRRRLVIWGYQFLV